MYTRLFFPVPSKTPGTCFTDGIETWARALLRLDCLRDELPAEALAEDLCWAYYALVVAFRAALLVDFWGALALVTAGGLAGRAGSFVWAWGLAGRRAAESF